METIRRRPRIVSKSELTAEDLPEKVTVALPGLIGAAREGLLALSVGLGLAVLNELFEEEVTRVAGPRGKHSPGRAAYRHGTEEVQVTMGGRRVAVRKPRARTVNKEEVELKTYRSFAGRDLLEEAALGRMLVGLSTRNYPAGLEPVGDVEAKATGKSSISRRFVAGTKRKLEEIFGRDLSKLDLLAVFIDGVEIGGHCIVVAMGVDSGGHKHALGLWEGSTENKTVCNALLGNLIERGLDPEVTRLFVIDGGKGIGASVKGTFGKHALIQRCQIHKRRNVLEHLPEAERTFIGGKLVRAWKQTDAAKAEAELRSLASHLEEQHPGAAASIREGLEETLTVTRLGLPAILLQTFKSTNPIESMISVERDVARNVKRWRSGAMALRWAAAGALEAEKKFRRIKGFRELPILQTALAAHQAEGTMVARKAVGA